MQMGLCAQGAGGAVCTGWVQMGLCAQGPRASSSVFTVSGA